MRWTSGWDLQFGIFTSISLADLFKVFVFFVYFLIFLPSFGQNFWRLTWDELEKDGMRSGKWPHVGLNSMGFWLILRHGCAASCVSPTVIMVWTLSPRRSLRWSVCNGRCSQLLHSVSEIPLMAFFCWFLKSRNSLWRAFKGSYSSVFADSWTSTSFCRIRQHCNAAAKNGVFFQWLQYPRRTSLGQWAASSTCQLQTGDCLFNCRCRRCYPQPVRLSVRRLLNRPAHIGSPAFFPMFLSSAENDRLSIRFHYVSITTHHAPWHFSGQDALHP